MLTFSRAGPTPMLSGSCAVLTVSKIGLLCFFLVRWQIFTGHGIRAKQHSAHEGTAALQPRYTHARATPHMILTSKQVGSFACWSDPHVLHVLCDAHHLHKPASSVHAGQVTNCGMFWDTCALLDAVSGIRVLCPSFCKVRAFFECSHVCWPRNGTRDMYDLQLFLACLQQCLTHLISGARMPIGRQCWSQNIRFHFHVNEHF